MYKRGPRIDPWGTPTLTGKNLENLEKQTTVISKKFCKGKILKLEEVKRSLAIIFWNSHQIGNLLD